MILLSVISSLVIIFFIYYYVVSINRDKKVVILALAFKILAGLAMGLVYKYYYGDGDTFRYFAEARTLTNYLLENPGKFFSIYFSTDDVVDLADQLIFHNQPRALFYVKLISGIYLFSGGNYWIMSIMMSSLNFLCIYYLVRQLADKYSSLANASYMSFYFLPTFVFWTSGLLKESLAIGALSVAVGLVLKICDDKQHSFVKDWLLLIISLILLWYLKYYYAAVLLPCLGFILVYERLTILPNIRLYFALGFVLFLGILITNSHYNLNLNRMLAIVYTNYQSSIALSESGAIHYYQFDGSILSFILNAPVALFSGLFRPLIFESESLFQYVVAIENLIVFITFVFAIWNSAFKVNWRNLFLLIALLYVIILSTIMAFSTPNFGTLSRYKVAYWPFFVLLVVALVLQHKKGQAKINLTSD